MLKNVTVANASTSTAVASPTPSLSFLRRDAFPVIHPLPLLPRQQSGILALTLTGGMLTDQGMYTNCHLHLHPQPLTPPIQPTEQVT